MNDESTKVNRVSRAIIFNNEGKVLLGRRMRNGGVGKFAFIGGTPDGDETAEQAVVREVKEEVGLDFTPTFYKETMDKLPEEAEAWLVTFFVGKAMGKLEFKADEVGEVIWVSREDLDRIEITFNHKDILKEFFAAHRQ